MLRMKKRDGHWEVGVPGRSCVVLEERLHVAIWRAALWTFWCYVVLKLFPWAWDFGSREAWIKFANSPTSSDASVLSRS